MAKIDKALQEAILAMPFNVKDKLLLKLIAKDNILIEQLSFQLIESENSLQTRRKAIEDAIDALYKMHPFSSGYLMMDMRSINAMITEHYKVTKDKYGEIELTLKLLLDCFEKQLSFIEHFNRKTETLCAYVAKRTEAILKKVVKMHPDEQFDFYTKLNSLLTFVHEYGSKYEAKSLGLPKNFEIIE